MSHRILARDGYHECYACGTAVEVMSDEDTDAAFRAIECQPGGWLHPAYIMGGQVETCLAHETYECSHVAEPGGYILEDPTDEDRATSHCSLCGLPVEWDPRNHWTHADLPVTVAA